MIFNTLINFFTLLFVEMQNVILKELAEIKVLLKEVIEIKFQATGVKLLESVDEVVTLDNKLKDKTEYTKLV